MSAGPTRPGPDAVGPAGDRGQLLLVGCVAVAFVVVGFTLVLNTALFVDNSSPALTNEQVEHARTFDLETRQGSRSLVHRINHGDPGRDGAALATDVATGVADYSALLAESYSVAEPATVNVSYNHGASLVGTRVVNDSDGRLPDGDLLAGARTEVGRLILNVNVTRTTTDPVTVRAENGSGWTTTLTVAANESGQLRNVTVESTLRDGSGTLLAEAAATCDPIGTRALVDGVSGAVVADRCEPDAAFVPIDAIDGPYDRLTVADGDRYGGTVGLVLNRTDFDAGGRYAACPDPDALCRTPAVWTANLTTTYLGDGVVFENDRNVTVYGP